MCLKSPKRFLLIRWARGSKTEKTKAKELSVALCTGFHRLKRAGCGVFSRGKHIKKYESASGVQGAVMGREECMVGLEIKGKGDWGQTEGFLYQAVEVYRLYSRKEWDAIKGFWAGKGHMVQSGRRRTLGQTEEHPVYTQHGEPDLKAQAGRATLTCELPVSSAFRLQIGKIRMHQKSRVVALCTCLCHSCFQRFKYFLLCHMKYTQVRKAGEKAITATSTTKS